MLDPVSRVCFEVLDCLLPEIKLNIFFVFIIEEKSRKRCAYLQFYVFVVMHKKSTRKTFKQMQIHLVTTTVKPLVYFRVFALFYFLTKSCSLSTTLIVKSRAVDRSAIQFWNFLVKGHST